MCTRAALTVVFTLGLLAAALGAAFIQIGTNLFNDVGDFLRGTGFTILDADGKPCGSMLIIAADDIEAAKALAAQDPYAKAGLFETVEIKPYNWVFNNPEA